MIPDEEQMAAGPVVFRDCDGCRVYPGELSWVSTPEFEGRAFHVPIRVGVVEQFELSYDCYAEFVEFTLRMDEMDWLEPMTQGPLLGELARSVLECYPGDELAVEVGEAAA